MAQHLIGSSLPWVSEFRSSSPSLSGRVGVKRFQTAPSRRSDVGCHSQGPRFSSGSALGPSHDGIRRMRRTNLPTRPCRKTYGRHKDSKRTRLIHRPCGDITPPVGGIHVSPVVLRHKCALTARSRRSSPGHAAAASSLVQRNSVPSTHMRCMMTASRRATATIARFIPRCRAIFMPQALSHDHLRL